MGRSILTSIGDGIDELGQAPLCNQSASFRVDQMQVRRRRIGFSPLCSPLPDVTTSGCKSQPPDSVANGDPGSAVVCI